MRKTQLDPRSNTLAPSQVKRTSCECITCPGWGTRFCTTTLRWRRNRAGPPSGTWRAASTTKSVRPVHHRTAVEKEPSEIGQHIIIFLTFISCLHQCLPLNDGRKVFFFCLRIAVNNSYIYCIRHIVSCVHSKGGGSKVCTRGQLR